jgi:DNA repair exonuclease SbcCD ATPase subunit
MSKNVEKIPDKHIEKIKPEKEHPKIEKLEPKELKEPFKEKLEHKEKPEPKEHKEYKEKDKDKDKEKEPIKEKHEPKEFKEPFKEHKEFKEVEKQVFEKGGKELAETTHPGDIVSQPVSKAATASDPSIKAKEIEKIKAEKEHVEKIKPEKEQIEKLKPEKEHIEKIKPEKEHLKNELKELKHEKNELKEHKIEIKEAKHEKLEIKEIEKLHQKDLLPEKGIFENDPKGIAEGGPINPGTNPGNPAPIFKRGAKAEDRLSDLENAVTRLSHFIGADLRPDLSSGALKQEPDVAKKGAKKAATKRRAPSKKAAG